MNPQPLLPRQLVPDLAVPTIDGAEFILSANPAEKFDLVVFIGACIAPFALSILLS
jgi:hypothetical protein